MSATTRPRQVSFSDQTRPRLAMTSVPASATSSSPDSSPPATRAKLPRSPAPPKIRERVLPPTTPATPPLGAARGYARSPYVHGRGDSASSADVFADSDDEKENWGGPVSSPVKGVGNGGKGKGGKAAEAALPRLDFSRAATPLTARKVFTPRPLVGGGCRGLEDDGPASPTRGRSKAAVQMLQSDVSGSEDDDDQDEEENQDIEDDAADNEDAQAVELVLGLYDLNVSEQSE